MRGIPRRHAALRHRLSDILGLLTLIAVLGGIVIARNGLVHAAERQATVGASPAELTTGAADMLAATTAAGGRGYTFEIVQTSTIVARPGGPLVDVPDPTDRHKSLGLAQSYALSTYLERGDVTPDGFWSEIRQGPDAPDAKPDFTTGDAELAALVRDGKSYRNDGAGWYPTSGLPGIGLDPTTAGLLPTMLRKAADPKDAPPDSATPPTNGAAVARTLEATTTVADVPGIVAVDLADFTELTEPAALSFDDAGRLLSVTITARNTALETWDLIVVTTISLAYPDSPPDLPIPEPTYVAPAPTKGEG